MSRLLTEIDLLRIRTFLEGVSRGTWSASYPYVMCNTPSSYHPVCEIQTGRPADGVFIAGAPTAVGSLLDHVAVLEQLLADADELREDNDAYRRGRLAATRDILRWLVNVSEQADALFAIQEAGKQLRALGG